MAAYYNRDGGCVAPTARVALANGTTKHAIDVRKGDVLSNGSRVKCAVAIKAPEDGLEMVQLKGGLWITPYHPVRAQEAPSSIVTATSKAAEWVFPTEAGAMRVEVKNRADLPLIYSFVLDGEAQWLSIDGVDVVAMGHGLTDNAVVAHEFFGTSAIVEQLSQLEGYAEGSVVVGSWVRDPTTMRVVGLTA